jgi:hypothetical protein
MTAIVRAVLLTAAVVIGLSAVPLTAVTGSFLATHAVAAAMRRAEATPDFLTLAAAPKLDRFAVDTPAGEHPERAGRSG